MGGVGGERSEGVLNIEALAMSEEYLDQGGVSLQGALAELQEGSNTSK